MILKEINFKRGGLIAYFLSCEIFLRSGSKIFEEVLDKK
nr:MAG TPA: hypothetical protein [Caudoviricetes sp.]